MAYDTGLAARIRAIIVKGSRKGVTEKEMFGGIAFLLDGKMFIGLAKNQLMVRVGPDRHDEALARPHVRPMDFTGRPMRGYVYVAPAGYANARALSAWIDWSTAFVATVKKKPKTARTAPKKRSRAA
jgi:TfoX/Sxy family transcriptional regulator of competence genes